MTGVLPPLEGAEAERALFDRVAAGDPAALQEAARRNLSLVARVARGFRGRGLDFDQVFSAGLEGLARAIRGFDPSLGHRFSTYATPWICQVIRRDITQLARPIRVPDGTAARLARGERLGSGPVADAARVLSASYVAIDGHNEHLFGGPEGDPGRDHAEAMEAAESVLARLSERERWLLRARARGLSFGEIAHACRCTKSWASQDYRITLRNARLIADGRPVTGDGLRARRGGGVTHEMKELCP